VTSRRARDAVRADEHLEQRRLRGEPQVHAALARHRRLLDEQQRARGIEPVDVQPRALDPRRIALAAEDVGIEVAERGRLARLRDDFP